MSLLRLENVSKRYGSVAALTAIDLTIAPGSRTAVVGPSGSGKTTLLRLIAGFEAPDAGRVTMEGRLLADDGAAVPAYQRGIGIVSQDGALFPHLSVSDNIGFGLGRRETGRAARIRELMALVELDAGLGPRRPDELSGGQQQRVALARALARRPRLMLLDEPFSALDTNLRGDTRRAVAALLGAAGIATILVTHDQSEALSFADQLAVFRGGRLAQVGSPRDLYLYPHDAEIAAFLGDAILLPARVADGWADCVLGRIAVGERVAHGEFQIMLRPEHLTLTKADAPGPGCGVVTGAEFGGAVCRTTVALAAADGRPGCAITLRGTPADQRAVGERVRVTLSGTAHVLPARCGRRPALA